MSAAQNKSGLAEGIERLNAGDIGGWLELHDPGVVAHGLAQEPVDHAGVRDFYEMLVAALHGFHVELGHVIAEHEDVAVRFTVTGTHSGELMNVPGSGRDVTINGISVYHFRGGRIVERWTSADVFGFLVQVGAIPAPEPAAA
jgi:predicted ester cyclase